MADPLASTAVRQEAELFVATLLWQADRDASDVKHFLRGWCRSLQVDPPPKFPMPFLIELATILRIARWQRIGLPADLQELFPAAEDLFDDLLRRFAENPMSFVGTRIPPPDKWSELVFFTWLHRFAWDAALDLNAEIVVADADEERVLDALADFLLRIQQFEKGE